LDTDFEYPVKTETKNKIEKNLNRNSKPEGHNYLKKNILF